MISTECGQWGDQSSKHLKYLIDHYQFNWKLLFDLANLGDIDKPLTKKILSNLSHPVVKHIIYIYTMECFIYDEIN